MPKLGINIDHVATLRQARREHEPDPVQAAAICERAGADGITVHLREDRRHIQEQDVIALRRSIATRLNLEMAATPAMLAFANDIKPDMATLVPERREELTTEGGLDVVGLQEGISHAVQTLQVRSGIPVSLFIEPDAAQVKASAGAGAAFVEFHTGVYARTYGTAEGARELARVREACALALELGLRVNMGHGLNYENVRLIAALEGVEELNIGHSIISRAVFEGLGTAVSEMKRLVTI